jgi:hypothetical protein
MASFIINLDLGGGEKAETGQGSHALSPQGALSVTCKYAIQFRALIG